MKLRLCLHYAVIKSSPRVGKNINKHEFDRKCLTIRVKDTKMNEIKIYSCVINFMIVTPVLNKEIEQWGEFSVLIKVNYVVYICSCSVRSE